MVESICCTTQSKSKAICLGIVYKSMFSVLIISLMLAVNGCSRYEKHTWQYEGNDSFVVKTISQIPIVAPQYYFHIDPNHLQETCKILETVQCCPITDELASSWCSNFARPRNYKLKPYLVRSVIYGIPSFAIIKYDPNTNELLTFHASYDGENLISEYFQKKVSAWPIVVYLPSEPKIVYPTAVLGGDAIFRCRDLTKLDMREICNKQMKH